MKKKEPIYFDSFDEEALHNIISTQRKITEHMKKQNHKSLYQILVIIDDFLDDSYLCKQCKIVWSLFTRGRHLQISTIISTQKYRAIANVIRLNATELYVFRLRNQADIEAFLEEISALAPKKELLDMYNIATEKPYSFLYVKLNAKDVNHMFFINFESRMLLEDDVAK